MCKHCPYLSRDAAISDSVASEWLPVAAPRFPAVCEAFFQVGARQMKSSIKTSRRCDVHVFARIYGAKNNERASVRRASLSRIHSAAITC